MGPDVTRWLWSAVGLTWSASTFRLILSRSHHRLQQTRGYRPDSSWLTPAASRSRENSMLLSRFARGHSAWPGDRGPKTDFRLASSTKQSSMASDEPLGPEESPQCQRFRRTSCCGSSRITTSSMHRPESTARTPWSRMLRARKSRPSSGRLASRRASRGSWRGPSDSCP